MASKRTRPPASGGTAYSQDVADAICARVAAGETLAEVCGTTGAPSYAALCEWRLRHPAFDEALERAREIAADLWAERALKVAEDSTSATATVDRLKVSTLIWRAERAAPERYGGKTQVRKEPRRVILEVRKFELAKRPDGQTYLREIMPERGEDDGR